MTARLAVLVALLAGGCSISAPERVAGEEPVNACEVDDDCRAGTCQDGACAVAAGEIDTLLVEVTPPEGVPSVGGARVLDVVHGLSVGRDDLVLDIPRLARLNGLVQPINPQEATGCIGDRGTVPVRVTLTPRQRLFGLSGVSYRATAERRVLDPDNPRPCDSELSEDDVVYDFSIDVPVGEYDLYVERDVDAPRADQCRFAPAAIRQSYTLEAGQVCLIVPLPESQKLDIVIDWPGPATGVRSLEGWAIDVVHPSSGRPLSEPTILGEANASVTAAGTVEYRINDLAFQPTGSAGTELVRLSPPEGARAPVIQLERSALTAATADVARIANLREFPAPVELQAWVWSAADIAEGREVPTAATVTLTATRLDGVDPGIFASYSTTTDVDEDGRLSVEIMPGEYRVRVVPPAASGYSAFETTLLAPCARLSSDPERCVARSSNDPEIVQAGKTLEVPRAAEVVGRVASPLGVEALEGATVAGLPGVTRLKRCPEDAGASCEPQVAGVLDVALGDDAFVPRTVSALVAGGRFAIDATDCALCEPERGAVYDFFVRPPDGSGYPWAVRAGVLVDGDVDLGPIEVTVPVMHQGVVQVPQGDTPYAVPGALLRAYVFRDRAGELINDPRAPACSELPPGSDAPCIRSILPVLETRADRDGHFRWFLPSQLW